MLPHIKNSKAGINRLDPIFKNLFEVYFTIPDAISSSFNSDVEVLTEHVTKIAGLDTLNKTPATVEQKFMGTDRSYIGSALDNTYHDITMTLNLNLRDATDNYVFKLFKAWQALAYDIQTGNRTIKEDHLAETLRIIQYNRAGDIFREIIYHDVMLTEVTGWDDVDYGATDLVELNIKFRSDWADEINA